MARLQMMREFHVFLLAGLLAFGLTPATPVLSAKSILPTTAL